MYTELCVCVCVFTAGHLPQKQHDYRRKYRTLASTYVTFGPDGNELLVNLGGEQIYLFDVNRRQLPRRFDVSIRQKISPAIQPEFKGCLLLTLLLFFVNSVFHFTLSTILNAVFYWLEVNEVHSLQFHMDTYW